MLLLTENEVMSNPLATELATFEKMKEDLLCQEGKYAVIFGADLLGVYDTYEDALKIGYEKCKLEPFLVKKIQAIEPINFFSRSIFSSCPT
jgi:hypothetical protein